jgi:tRNA1(Val) A37 N6-methylase TrmN6
LGSGKGKIDFFLAYFNKAKMTGVEYDLRLYNIALEEYIAVYEMIYEGKRWRYHII